MACVDARVDDGDDHARCTLREVPGPGQVELAQAPLARPELVVRRRVERLEDRRLAVFDPTSGRVSLWSPEQLYERGGGWPLTVRRWGRPDEVGE